MKFLKQILAGTLIVSIATSSVAQETSPIAQITPPAPVAGEKDVGAAISPMLKGQTAPFTGLLLSPTAVATIITDYKSFDTKIAIEVAKARGDVEAKCTFKLNEADAHAISDKKILQAQLDQKVAENKILQDQIAAAPSRPVWFGLGMLGGVLFTSLTVFVVSQAIK